MTKKPTKAYLTKQLRKRDIPIPKGAKIETLEHRLKYWLPGEGFHVRPLKYTGTHNFSNSPVKLLTDKNALYWIPNSKMAHVIVGSRVVLILDRTNKPSNDAIILDVPIDYDEVFNDGGNDSTNP